MGFIKVILWDFNKVIHGMIVVKILNLYLQTNISIKRNSTTSRYLVFLELLFIFFSEFSLLSFFGIALYFFFRD